MQMLNHKLAIIAFIGKLSITFVWHLDAARSQQQNQDFNRFLLNKTMCNASAWIRMAIVLANTSSNMTRALPLNDGKGRGGLAWPQ